MNDSLSRRQALGLLTAPLTLPLVTACRDAFAPKFTPTFSLSDTPITLIGAGDVHAAYAGLATRSSTAALVKKVLDADPEARAFMVGDLVHTGLAKQYKNFYHPTWGAFKDRTIFNPGNHDRNSEPFGVAYNEYVGVPKYHATTLGAWRIYSLDCQPLAKGGSDQAEQFAWLKADLAANANKQIAAFFHYPMFSSVCEYHSMLNMKPDDMTFKGRIGPWWDVLQAAGCSFAVSGHAHRYERLQPLLRNGTVSERGIRQFVCGTAGATVRDIVPPAHSASESIAVEHGVVRFDLYPDRYEWSFTDITGVKRDRGSQLCRQAVAV
jgi:hypothetical protein